MLPRFQRLIQKRKYLNNVPPRTIEWYQQSLAGLTVEQSTAEEFGASSTPVSAATRAGGRAYL